jgi:hypothetical protein
MPPRTKRATPPFMVKRVVLFVLAQLAVSVVGFVPLFGMLPKSTAWSLAPQGVMLLLQGAFTWWFVLSFVRMNRRVRAAGGRACWTCCYILTGLPDDGTCPECGSHYRLEDLKTRWQI